MSTETNKTPIAKSKSEPSPMQSSMVAEHAAKPQAGQTQSVAAAPKADAHACCHTISLAGPATTVGVMHTSAAA